MATERKGGTAPLRPVKGRPGMFIYGGDRPSSSASEDVWREVGQRELQRGEGKAADPSTGKPTKDES